MSRNKMKEMSKTLEAVLDGLHLAAVVQVKSMDVFEISETECEVHIDCDGLEWDKGFPLGLYFFGNFSDADIDTLRTLYSIGRILRVEGTYSVLFPESGGITLYDCTATELTEEDSNWLKAHPLH